MIATDTPLAAQSPFVGYAYSYPHKSAYRQLDPPVPLAEVWEKEDRDSLFLYLHLPFCEYRCGFCNLFTTAHAEPAWIADYLRQLRVEAGVVAGILRGARFARMAIGGGTPTFLSEGQLAELLEITSLLLGASPENVPSSCEASPATLTDQKARLLRSWGTTRLSLGVQTFNEAESRKLGRPQRLYDVQRAIDIARKYDFPILNLDLIYGAADQSLASWMTSVERAISFRPQEIYLYPLYIRDHTGLGRIASTPNDNRVSCYRAARERLLESGYEQISLRMFQLATPHASDAPIYCCQSDGMVGLGCGARSYTRELHYSTEFAVGRTGVRNILADYLARSAHAFSAASHGIHLSLGEQQRRYAIQSLLQTAGLCRISYRKRFDSDVLDNVPQLATLQDSGLAIIEADAIRLTSVGLEWSDAIGPWLYSPEVRQLMEQFECH